MLKLYLYLFWSNNEDIAVCTTYILSICCNICCIVVTVLLISAHKNVMFTCFSFLPFVTPRGKALKKITYTWLKKSRKKSKKYRTPFFQVLYPSCYSSCICFFFQFFSTDDVTKFDVWCFDIWFHVFLATWSFFFKFRMRTSSFIQPFYLVVPVRFAKTPPQTILQRFKTLLSG